MPVPAKVNLQAIKDIIESMQEMPGATLPILHAIQEQFGYIPLEGIQLIANALNQSVAEIHGVISFYHHFSISPHGKYTIELCRAESCQSMGSRQLEKAVKEKLGIDFHQTTDDGKFTLEPVYCLGNCACSPAIKINNTIHGRMTVAKTAAVFDQLDQKKAGK